MKPQQSIQMFIKEKKNFYDNIVNYLENIDGIQGEYCYNLEEIINIQKIEGNREDIFQILQILKNIADNHHGVPNFIEKINKIILSFKDQVQQTFSNKEIFDIFQTNKKILLFLLENKIVILSEEIIIEMKDKIDPNGTRFCHFFYPEIKCFIGEESSKEIKEEILKIDSNAFDNFDIKRKEGENDSYICCLIRDDSVEEFIAYVNRKNISLTSEIEHSIFETNCLLMENDNVSLIEYCAFFGSIQIFQYLFLNNVELTSSLWIYAIHSENAELIHLLEYNKVDPPNNNYELCLIESIKCHHNKIAEYFKNNYMNEKENKDEIRSNILRYYNYAYFPTEFSGENDFFNLCSNNYHTIVNLLLKDKKHEIEETIV